ncbi:vWA domain-containing protein [Desulfitobacterium hafniense]|uniref:vWA domain-containing protein n=1 Tax=Desulfitobacterium hafniense TaxID=49338 RepID=UPI0003A32D16|nr:VWA-like domain-containing protein [Desulfitobacterium hafniense]
MMSQFENQAQALYEQATLIIEEFYRSQRQGHQAVIHLPQGFKDEFFSLVNQVNLSLLEDKDNFYSYFLMQMSREIRFDITSPTGVNFQGTHYVIHFNPMLFLNLNLRQMASTIKHEILHILSGHLWRAKALQGRYSTLAINMAMNIVVNTYLDDLPPYSVTLEWVNVHYALKLLPFKPFEYYVEEIQAALDLLAADEAAEAERDGDETEESRESDELKYAEESNEPDHNNDADEIKTAYDPERTHDLWQESSAADEQTLREFTEKFVAHAQKGGLPGYLENMLSSLRNSQGELPWNLYLKRLMGTVPGDIKKTMTRRNRRQPERLDLRGQLRSHQAKILVALDISGSISDQEFNQAIKEVLAIVKNYHHEITIVECDSEIRRTYKVKTVRDVQERLKIRGGTRFTPVFEYANEHKVNVLIYFTDGQGEAKLQTIPRGYKTLWVLSGRGKELSLGKPYGAVKKLKQMEVKDDTLRMSDVKTEGFSMQDQERLD